MTIPANIAAVRARIDAACERAGRSPDEVTLIAVSKGFSADAIAEAAAASLAMPFTSSPFLQGQPRWLIMDTPDSPPEKAA